MNKLVSTSIVFIALVVLVIVLQKLQFLVRPLIVAIILTMLLMPIFRYFEARKVPFIATFAGLIGVCILLIVALVFLFSSSLSEINQSLPEQQQRASDLVQQLSAFLNNNELGKQVSLQFMDSAKFGSYVASLLAGIVNVIRLIVTELFLVILFMLFLIPSYKRFLKDIERHYGQANAGKVRRILVQIERSIKDYLATKAFISLCIAFISAFMLSFFGAELVLISSAAIFLFNFVPAIGSFIAITFTLSLYFFSHGLSLNLLWIGLLLVGVQMLFENIIEPKIAGTKLRLSPLIIILGLLFWGWTWGVVGMILAVPLMSIIKIILENIESTKVVAKFMG